MQRLLLIVLFFSLFSHLAFAEKEDIGDFDGNSWLGWSTEKKLSFLSGFLSAAGYIVSANQDGTYYCASFTSSDYDSDKAGNAWTIFYYSDKKKKATFSRREVALMLDSDIINRNERLSPYGVYGITIGQLYEGLNLFYGDFKNKQLKLPVAIYVVKKQIKGASAEEIEAIVQWLRDDSKDFRKRFFIDKEGKKKFVAFP